MKDIPSNKRQAFLDRAKQLFALLVTSLDDVIDEEEERDAKSFNRNTADNQQTNEA